MPTIAPERKTLTPPERDAAALLGTDKRTGTSPEALVEGAEALGLTAEARSGMTVEDLAAAVAAQRPVICAVQMTGDGSGNGQGHYVVVADVSNTSVIVQDPARGRVRIGRKLWERRWHDVDAEGTEYVRWGLVLGKPVTTRKCMEGENAHKPGPCPQGGGESSGEGQHASGGDSGEPSGGKHRARNIFDVYDELEELRNQSVPPRRPETGEEIAASEKYHEETRRFFATLIDVADFQTPEDYEDFTDEEKAGVEEYRQALREQAKKTADEVIKWMTPRMQGNFRRYLGGIHLYADTYQLTEEVGLEEGICGGFYQSYHTDRVGTLHVDGGYPDRPDTAREIYAHEFGHVIDGPGRRYSNDGDWWKVWSEEIDRDEEPLSRYARKNPTEGFAEFSRLLLTGQYKHARMSFPKCYAFWANKGLL